MSWKTRVASCTLLLAALAGCTRQVYLSDSEAQNMRVGGKLPGADELKPARITQPLCGHDFSGKWANVLDPDSRDIRYLSLAEAIALSLENGHAGSPGLNGTDSLLVGVNGLAPENTEDSIRVFSLNPAIQQASIESALSRFDVRFASSMTWTTTDEPLGAAQSAQLGNVSGAMGGAGQGTGSLTSLGSTGVAALSSQAANFNTSLVKPLATGGTVGITYAVPYLYSNLQNSNTGFSPTYTPSLTLGFEQPLLKGFGVDINQITTAHPGSNLFPNATTGTINATEGIIITRLRYDQARAEFERLVNNMLVNVETAYWNLYAQYWTLYSQEAGLRQTWETWKVTKAKFQAGLATEADVEESRAQYELFRSSRLTALQQVIEDERILRDLLGLPLADGTRLVPSDTPTVAPYRPDPDLALQQALALRPELVEAREQLKFRQIDMARAKNDYLPDLRFVSQYGITGLGSRLDGASPDNALISQMSDHFDNWMMGLTLTMPLGRRDAEAGERIARLHLAQTTVAVQSMEEKAAHFAFQQYNAVLANYEQIAINRNRREALAKQVQANFQQWQAGKITLDILLTAQQNWATALQSESNAIAAYNNTLILFEYAKGTIMQHDNVIIAEGPLPSCVAKRAAENAREENDGIVLRKRAEPAIHCPAAPGSCSVPQLPTDQAVSLPSLLEQAPRMGKDLPERLDPVPASSSAKPAAGDGPMDLFSDPSK